MYIHYLVQQALEDAARKSTEEQASKVHVHHSNGGEWASTTWETKDVGGDDDTVQVSEEVDW